MDIAISLVQKFGEVLEIDVNTIASGVSKENILVYMGMIEQKVTEMMLD